jgi:hypothetical protein
VDKVTPIRPGVIPGAMVSHQAMLEAATALATTRKALEASTTMLQEVAFELQASRAENEILRARVKFLERRPILRLCEEAAHE